MAGVTIVVFYRRRRRESLVSTFADLYSHQVEPWPKWNHGCGFRPRTHQPDCV